MDQESIERIRTLRRTALNEIDEAPTLLEETRAAGRAEALNDVLNILEGRDA